MRSSPNGKSELVPPWRTFIALSEQLPHPVTSLAAFDDQTRTLAAKAPDNYSWYQAKFERRVEEVHSQLQLEFLRRLRASFPANGPSMSQEETLDRLVSISGGWREWAASMG